MEPLVWQDSMRVGHPVIDADHEETVVMLTACLNADDTAFAAAWKTFHQHIIDHFGRENALMDTYGFPAAGIHQAEHTRVLEMMDELDKAAGQGALNEVRDQLRDDVASWFVSHLGSMDHVTAQFLRMAERARARQTASDPAA